MKLLIKSACAASLIALGAGVSQAATIDTGADGVLSPFGGFDWASAGSSVTVGSIEAGQTVTTLYWANAVSVQDPNGNVFGTPNLDTGILVNGAYEYTVVALFQESVSCPVDPTCNTSATFTITSGQWAIFYDTSPDANLVTGTGFLDGTAILEGTVNPGLAGSFSLGQCTGGAGGSGSFAFTGIVTNTNNAFVNPDLTGSTAGAEIKFGTCTTAWQAPTGTPLGAIPEGAVVLQADGNQSFQVAVPEPGSLALLGGALGLMGWATRRRKAA